MRKMRRLEHERCPNCGAKKLQLIHHMETIYNYKDYQKEREFRRQNKYWLTTPERPSWEFAIYKCECCGSKLKVKKEIHFERRTIPIRIE